MRSTLSTFVDKKWYRSNQFEKLGLIKIQRGQSAWYNLCIQFHGWMLANKGYRLHWWMWIQFIASVWERLEKSMVKTLNDLLSTQRGANISLILAIHFQLLNRSYTKALYQHFFLFIKILFYIDFLVDSYKDQLLKEGFIFLVYVEQTPF